MIGAVLPLLDSSTAQTKAANGGRPVPRGGQGIVEGAGGGR
jgi:hypothetical protein